jgi:hypothetical protein
VFTNVTEYMQQFDHQRHLRIDLLKPHGALLTVLAAQCCKVWEIGADGLKSNGGADLTSLS